MSHNQSKVLKIWIKQREYLKVLYQDFKDTNWTFQVFLILLIIRNTAAAFIYTILFKYPLLQSLLLLILTVLVIISLIIKKPFVEKNQLLSQLLFETIILAVNIIDFILSILDNSGSSDLNPREKLSKGIIVLSTILMILSFLLLLLDILKVIHNLYTRLKFTLTKEGIASS